MNTASVLIAAGDGILWSVTFHCENYAHLVQGCCSSVATVPLAKSVSSAVHGLLCVTLSGCTACTDNAQAVAAASATTLATDIKVAVARAQASVTASNGEL